MVATTPEEIQKNLDASKKKQAEEDRVKNTPQLLFKELGLDYCGGNQ